MKTVVSTRNQPVITELLRRLHDARAVAYAVLDNTYEDRQPLSVEATVQLLNELAHISAIIQEAHARNKTTPPG